jgi:hypothetical protein
MAGKRAHMPRGYSRWTRKRWFGRLCEEVVIKRRRSRHLWQVWPPGILRTAAQLAYCSIKGRELGDRPPAARWCPKRLPPGTGRQCWNWRVAGTDRCWRHPRDGA